MTYEKWKQQWRISTTGERLGQAFVNQFLSGVEAGQLFYAADHWLADQMIEQWLIDNCYFPNMPPKVG